MSHHDSLYFDHLATPLGNLFLAANDRGLQSVSFYDDTPNDLPENWIHDPSKLANATLQLNQYFKGQRLQFDLPLAPLGTPFQCRVWLALTKIPYGKTITYGELACMVDSPKGFRAVGNANGKNPLVIIQPCHRVIASGGKLGGFSAGLYRKKYLLKLERGVHTIFNQ